jgi:hypothetical protein
MANPTNTIADAFEKLKRSISDDDAQDFASTDLKAVWKAVRNIDNAQRRRQSAQNLRRIEPLLRGIEKYSKVIEVLCNGTPYMPYVWVGYFNCHWAYILSSQLAGSNQAYDTGQSMSVTFQFHFGLLSNMCIS